MSDAFEKKELSEMDIRTKYITPAIESAGWNKFSQLREEYTVTKGRIIARGKTCKREAPLKADYVLFYKPNKPIAIVEAKDNKHTMSDGMQQALGYAAMMDVPFVFSSNGDGFVFHNKFITEGEVETTLSLDEFPSPETLWKMYHEKCGISPEQDKIIDEPYYSDNPDKMPRYRFHLQDAFERIQMDLNNSDKFATFIMDELNVDTIKQIKAACHDFTVHGDFVKYKNLYQGVLIENSLFSPGIQLADYVAGVLNGFLRGQTISPGNYQYATDLYTEFIKPNLRQHSNGTITGYGVIDIPKRTTFRPQLERIFDNV